MTQNDTHVTLIILTRGCWGQPPQQTPQLLTDSLGVVEVGPGPPPPPPSPWYHNLHLNQFPLHKDDECVKAQILGGVGVLGGVMGGPRSGLVWGGCGEACMALVTHVPPRRH